MPPKKGLPQIHLMIKTHRYNLALTLFPTSTLRDLKTLAISALAQFADGDPDPGFPLRPTEDDFEIARRVEPAVKGGALFETLEEGSRAMDLQLRAWNKLYLQWKDSEGNLLPVKVTAMSFYGEDEDEPMNPVPPPPPPAAEPVPVTGKGKRKERDF